VYIYTRTLLPYFWEIQQFKTKIRIKVTVKIIYLGLTGKTHYMLQHATSNQAKSARCSCTVMAQFCLAVTPRKSRWKPYYTDDVVQQQDIPGRLAQFSRRSRHSRLSPPRHQKLFRGRLSCISRTSSPSVVPLHLLPD